MNTPDPVTDGARLAALESLNILDTPPEQAFDDVVHLARLICEAPVALVSLVAADRQWFKARIGFEPCQTDLASSVCAHALVEPDLLIIPDLAEDPRTRANPLVSGEPHIRFYAGAPLRMSDGHIVGSLCVIDGVPRPRGLTEAQAQALRALGRQVVGQLELRRSLAERDRLLLESREADARRRGLFEIGDRLRNLETIPEMIQAACEIVGRTLGVSRAGFGYLDAATEYIDVVSDWTVEGVASIIGRHRFDDYGNLREGLLIGEPLVIENVRKDPRTASSPDALLALEVVSLVNAPVLERGRIVALLLVHDRQPREWSPETLAFVRNVADRLQTGAARVAAENQQQLLNSEISHRMKNMMTMISAIGTQTLRAVPDKRPVEAFTRRIRALSIGHDILLKRSWQAAKLEEVSSAVLGAFDVDHRIALAGPTFDLGPRATLSVSLLLHELATNAIKYGALSSADGRIAVGWRVEQAADEGEELVLDWTESGGPEPAATRGRGFGSRLIRMGLVGGGGATLRFDPTGLQAEFRAPVDQARQA